MTAIAPLLSGAEGTSAAWPLYDRVGILGGSHDHCSCDRGPCVGKWFRFGHVQDPTGATWKLAREKP